MSLHCFILSASIISDFGHIPVVHSHIPCLQCVCGVCAFNSWQVCSWRVDLSFPLFVCVSLFPQRYKYKPHHYCTSFFCPRIILCICLNLTGCAWIQSVPVISAGQRAATEASPLTPLCWTLFCSDALHLITLYLFFFFFHLYHYVLRDESAGWECVFPFGPEWCTFK